MKTLILSFAFATLVPAASWAAATPPPVKGPGCGGLTAPVGGFKFVSPFGDLLLQENAAFVRREEIVKTWDKAAMTNVTALKFEGTWSEILSARDNEALGVYTPSGMGKDGSKITFTTKPSSRPPDFPSLDTPFGKGFAPDEAKDLDMMRFDGGLYGKRSPYAAFEAPAKIAGTSTARISQEFKADSWHEGYGSALGDTTYDTGCRLIDDKTMLCQVDRSIKLASGGWARRIEYYGFKKTISPEVEALLKKSLNNAVEQLKGYGKEKN